MSNVAWGYINYIKHGFDGFNLEHKLSEAVKTVSRTEHIQFFLCLYSISAHQCNHPLVVTTTPKVWLAISVLCIWAAKFPYQVGSWHLQFQSTRAGLMYNCLEMSNIMVYCMIFRDIPFDEAPDLLLHPTIFTVQMVRQARSSHLCGLSQTGSSWENLLKHK